MAVIEIRNLVKDFGARRIIDNVSLQIEKGETMVIMGGSGCGKSTLLRMMIGALKPDSGKIFIKEKDVTCLNEDEMDEARKHFGMLFQGAALFNSMTVGENVALPLREHTKLNDTIIGIMVKMKLELVGLTGFEDLKPAEISGGMKKRVGLARAIAMDPEIVFYDEPGAGLDPVMASVIDKLIMDLSRKLGITSVVVTHEMGSAFRIADRMAMLHQGRIIEIGTPQEIKDSKNGIIQQFITGSPDGPIPLRRSSKDYLKDLMGG
ncbi:MAG: ABC transporter ATP-binding protein [Candidatus Omnitrophota bacterium]|nr:ABC transporter ATP-binding protein [Candidatus Omnitrophota bacterium]